MSDITWPCSVRIKFKKYGAMKFIGHLDVMRYFQKLFRRSGVDIAYTEGFHPHQVMSFANPLGVGLISEGEYLDVTLNSSESSASLVEALNRQNVEGYEIVDAVILPENAKNAMSSVGFASYRVNLKISEEELKGFVSQAEISYEKKTKKGTKILDIKNGIKTIKTDGENITMKVSAGSAVNVRPEFVVESILKYLGRTEAAGAYTYTRLEIFDTEGVPLIDVGSRY